MFTMNKKLGVIGVGTMGSAIVENIVRTKLIPHEKVYIFDIDKQKKDCVKGKTGVDSATTSIELVEKSDIIVLAVKPHIVKSVLEECAEVFDNKKILVSIAVGLPIKYYEDIIGKDAKIVRVMPNTPLQVGEGMTLLSFNLNLSGQEKKEVYSIFNCAGKVSELSEDLMSEVTALTGSSPAYVYMFIEAMADAAVYSGIPRDVTYKLAAQAVLGAAKMVLESGKHPGELKDQVCTPAGTTIEAATVLEKLGFRNAVIEAMKACTKRARKIGDS